MVLIAISLLFWRFLCYEIGLLKKSSVFGCFTTLGGKLRNFRPEAILQKLLARCVVDTSYQMGILGTPDELSMAHDGTAFYSGASHYGTKVWNCRSKGIFNCHCFRRYSDPDAKWGWDSYREQWFYGSTLFNVTASDSPYDLPIYLKSVQASRHDSITTVFALQDIEALYPNMKFKITLLTALWITMLHTNC